MHLVGFHYKNKEDKLVTDVSPRYALYVTGLIHSLINALDFIFKLGHIVTDVLYRDAHTYYPLIILIISIVITSIFTGLFSNYSIQSHYDRHHVAFHDRRSKFLYSGKTKFYLAQAEEN